MNNYLEDHRETIENNTFPKNNGVVLTVISDDYCEGYVDVTEKSMNAYNVVHGGVYFTLADVVAAFAARSNGKKYVTQQCSMNFIRGVQGGRISCKANVINRGRTFCIIEAKITDDRDKLVYSGTFNYFCIE